MDVANKVAKNSAIMIATEILNKVLSLILTIALARYLGDIGFGQYSFVVTMMLIFQVLSDFGLDGLAIREIAKDIGKTRIYLNNLLALKLALSTTSFLVLSVIINLMHKPLDIVYSTYVAGIAIIFCSLANTFASVFNAHERLDVRAFPLLLSRVVVIAVSFYAIFLKKGLISLISAVLVGEIIRTVIGWRLCHNKFAKIDFKIDPSLCKKLFITSIPFGAIGMIALIYFKIDIVMLSLMKGDKVVGWYSAAYALLAALLFIAEAYNLSIFPALSRYADTARNLLLFGWERSVKYLLIVSLPVSVGTTILAGRFISLLYSKDYAPSVIAVQILIWALPWIFINSINMRVLYAADRQKEAVIVAFISMVLNIAFNFVLIPRYSYVGASIATITVEVINTLVYFWLVSKLFGMKARIANILPKPMLASAVMGVLVYYLGHINLVLAVLSGAVFYFIVLILLRTFDGEDRRILGKVVPILSKAGIL